MSILHLVRARHSCSTTSITSIISLIHTRGTSRSPVPVLLIGATKGVGRPVTEHLRPEYEVIHFMQSLDHAKKVIPQILSGSRQPETGNDAIGSLNFDKKPMAVVLGGAFDMETVQDLRAHVTKAMNQSQSGEGEASKTGVAWLARGPDAGERLGKAGPGYSLKAVEAVKVVLNRLRDHGELEKDKVHFW